MHRLRTTDCAGNYFYDGTGVAMEVLNFFDCVLRTLWCCLAQENVFLNFVDLAIPPKN